MESATVGHLLSSGFNIFAWNIEESSYKVWLVDSVRIIPAQKRAFDLL